MADERNRMLEQLNTDDWQECRQSVLIVDESLYLAKLDGREVRGNAL